jgi:hypothetical protein
MGSERVDLDDERGVLPQAVDPDRADLVIA